MSPEEKAFSDALEVYEKLLNSETQAIVAVDLDKLEAILKSKDEALRSVLESRDALDDDPRENSTFSKILDCIIDIQGRNAQTLENLLKEQTKKKEETTEGANRLRKVREAYSSHLGAEGKRLKV